MWCRSRRFNCILLVFFRRWGRLVMRDLIKHDALLWLVVFSTALIGAFRSLLFTQWFAPSAVRCRTALLLLCSLIVGIHASGISIPLSLLILMLLSLIDNFYKLFMIQLPFFSVKSFYSFLIGREAQNGWRSATCAANLLIWLLLASHWRHAL